MCECLLCNGEKTLMKIDNRVKERGRGEGATEKCNENEKEMTEFLGKIICIFFNKYCTIH